MTFDPFADARPSDPVPQGTHTVRIESGEIVDTKTGGKSAKFKFRVMGGQYHDRVLFGDFLLSHPNRAQNYQNAAIMGKQIFADLALACGVCHPKWVQHSKKAKDAVENGSAKLIDGTFSGNFSELIGHTVVGVWDKSGKYINAKRFAAYDPSAAPIEEGAVVADNDPPF